MCFPWHGRIIMIKSAPFRYFANEGNKTNGLNKATVNLITSGEIVRPGNGGNTGNGCGGGGAW